MPTHGDIARQAARISDERRDRERLGEAIVTHGLYYYHRGCLRSLARYSPNSAANVAWDAANKIRCDAVRWLSALVDADMVTHDPDTDEYAITDFGRTWL